MEGGGENAGGEPLGTTNETLGVGRARERD